MASAVVPGADGQRPDGREPAGGPGHVEVPEYGRVPYRGIAKNNAWLASRAAALNLRRLINLGLTRTTDGTWTLA